MEFYSFYVYFRVVVISFFKCFERWRVGGVSGWYVGVVCRGGMSGWYVGGVSRRCVVEVCRGWNDVEMWAEGWRPVTRSALLSGYLGKSGHLPRFKHCIAS